MEKDERKVLRKKFNSNLRFTVMTLLLTFLIVAGIIKGAYCNSHESRYICYGGPGYNPYTPLWMFLVEIGLTLVMVGYLAYLTVDTLRSLNKYRSSCPAGVPKKDIVLITCFGGMPLWVFLGFIAFML